LIDRAREQLLQQREDPITLEDELKTTEKAHEELNFPPSTDIDIVLQSAASFLKHLSHKLRPLTVGNQNRGRDKGNLQRLLDGAVKKIVLLATHNNAQAVEGKLLQNIQFKSSIDISISQFLILVVLRDGLCNVRDIVLYPSNDLYPQ